MRLITAIRLAIGDLTTSRTNAVSGSSSQPFERALVNSRRGDGKVNITVQGQSDSIVGTPLTDEPYGTGDWVWVSSTDTGYVIHGGIR